MSDKTTIAGMASRALAWNFLSTVLTRLGPLAINVMLARLLGPGAFGAYAVALVALFAMQQFNDLGVGLAIVRWEADPGQIVPTVTTVSVIFSVVIYAGCFAVAPLYATAMGAPAATGVVRVLAIAILIDGFCTAPIGLLQRNFKQGRSTIALQIGGWVGIGVTVTLAWSHHGVMSLAIGHVTGALIVAVLLIAFAPESLHMGFDPVQARALFRFGLPLAGANVITLAVRNVDQIVIGHMLGSVQLGLFVLALGLASSPPNLFRGAVRNVAPAVFARLQHDHLAMRDSFLSTAGLLTAVTLPLCLLIGASAKPLVAFVYGARWLPAAQPLIWLAIAAGARILFELAYEYLVVLQRTRFLLIVQIMWLLALLPLLIVATRADGIYGSGLAEAAVALLVVLPCYLGGLNRVGLKLSILGKNVFLPVVTSAAAGLAAVGLHKVTRSDLTSLTTSSLVTFAMMGLLTYRMRPTFALLKRASAAQSGLSSGDGPAAAGGAAQRRHHGAAANTKPPGHWESGDRRQPNLEQHWE